MGLIPILLVERNATLSQSTWVMALVKGAALLGVLSGGWLTDRYSIRFVLIFSFLVSGIGMLMVPFVSGIALIALFAILSNFGQSMFPSTAQLMVRKTIPASQRQEAMGWLRTVNNLGSISSYALALLFSGAGSMMLFLYDGLTSIGAAAIADKTIPEAKVSESDRAKIPAGESSRALRVGSTFWAFAGFISCFNFIYELFMTASAAQAQVRLGSAGLVLFSRMMLVNTILCTLLALGASKFFKNPKRVLPIGLLLMISGCALLMKGNSNWYYMAVFIVTLGEISFTSLSSFVLMSLLPKVENSGSIYSVAILMQMVARMGGAGVAFWWIQTPHAALMLAGVAMVAAALGWLGLTRQEAHLLAN